VMSAIAVRNGVVYLGGSFSQVAVSHAALSRRSMRPPAPAALDGQRHRRRVTEHGHEERHPDRRGNFSNIGGQARKLPPEVLKGSGRQPLNPNPIAFPSALELTERTLYAGACSRTSAPDTVSHPRLSIAARGWSRLESQCERRGETRSPHQDRSFMSGGLHQHRRSDAQSPRRDRFGERPRTAWNPGRTVLDVHAACARGSRFTSRVFTTIAVNPGG
jgi:hypothetical protein